MSLKISYLRSANFFCSSLALCWRAASSPVELTWPGQRSFRTAFWVPIFSYKNANPFSVLSSVFLVG